VLTTVLLQGIGTVRAHFFASFHSSRESQRPIARKTLTAVTGVARRSQHSYERRAGVKKQHNWAVGNAPTRSETEQRVWQHGHAVFELKDHQGKSGAAGESHLAWQLPNSYAGPHAPQAIARRKRINQQLADLFNKGMTGNGEQMVEHAIDDVHEGAATRYFEHGRAAARAYNRGARNDLYWRTPMSYRRYRVWHILPASAP
jgi:hypothetical protein